MIARLLFPTFKPTTLNIPISEDGKLVKVTLNSFLCYELMPPKYSGSIVLPGTWCYSLKVPALGMKVAALGIVQPSSWHSSLKYQHLAQFIDKPCGTHYFFFKSMVNEHRIYHSH
jgi:hypothetical protein